ncbi:hypothetical protein ACWDR0_31920 [Streptomyces sp. NPDC003691]
MVAPLGGPPLGERLTDGYVVTPGPGCSPSFQEYVAAARAGAFETLLSFEAPEFDPAVREQTDPVELAFKLLLVAADSGLTEAHDLVDDLLHGSDLAHDDDGFTRGNAHFELGLAYLLGADGLPADPGRARTHLVRAQSYGWPGNVVGGESLLRRARALLSAPLLGVFDEVYGPG